ncbi:MAG: class I tRNA ligase family protein [Rhodobacteraceae bacterium]|nr:class I tRNA ligase family protein [Paracoccaceae bacterium]
MSDREISAARRQVAHLTRDPDVLDTWFSSGLWPIGTLGLAQETEELKTALPDRCPRHRLRHHLLLGRPG